MNPFAEMYEREIREMGTDRLRGDVKQMVFLDGTYHEGVGWWLDPDHNFAAIWCSKGLGFLLSFLEISNSNFCK